MIPQSSFLMCAIRWFCIAITAVVVLLAAYAAYRLIPEHTKTYTTMEDHFKYGSTRGDLVLGFPYWIWQAMPLSCSNTLEEIAGERLAPDYQQRVREYFTSKDPDRFKRRQNLSREGYKALGFLYETTADNQERDLPIGTSQRHSLGLDRVFINCAVCHSSRVRKDKHDPGTLVLGMPANLFNLARFEQFVFRCVKSEGFGQLSLVPEIDALGGNVSLIDRYLVYPFAISGMKEALQFLENFVGFSFRQPPWGPGRTDTFTNAKSFAGDDWRRNMQDYNKTGKVDPEGLGTTDFPSIWLQGPRKKRADGLQMELHWDGNNNTVEERNLDAAMASGALPPVTDHESIECIEQWLLTFEPPKYTFPINQDLAQKGEPIYQEYCADCHGKNGRDFTGSKVGFVTPLAAINTDAYRLNNFTQELALNLATFYAGKKRESKAHTCPGNFMFQPPAPRKVEGQNTAQMRIEQIDAEENTYRFKHFHKTNGYANSPLDGVWLRAPYLHNGSVPTLRDLLEPGDKRPTQFYRGNDVYDPNKIGFVSTERIDGEGKTLFNYDTTVPGNSNQGHEGHEYGTDLQEDEKEALLEYLKTF